MTLCNTFDLSLIPIFGITWIFKNEIHNGQIVMIFYISNEIIRFKYFVENNVYILMSIENMVVIALLKVQQYTKDTLSLQLIMIRCF